MMESNYCLDEFRWNLERLLRILFQQGLLLTDLVSKYKKYFQKQVRPEVLVPGSNNWKDAFKHPQLRKHFELKRMFGGHRIFLRQTIQDEEELKRLFHLTSYKKYVESKSTEPKLSRQTPKDITPRIADGDYGMNITTISDFPASASIDEAEASDPLVVDAALVLAMYFLKAIPGRSVIEIAEQLGLLQGSGSSTPCTPFTSYPDVVLSSPKEAFSPGPYTSSGTRMSERDSGQQDCVPESQPRETEKTDSTDSKDLDPELADDLTDDVDTFEFANKEELNSLIDENLFGSVDADLTLDEGLLELHQRLFGGEDDNDVHQELDCIVDLGYTELNLSSVGSKELAHADATGLTGCANIQPSKESNVPALSNPAEDFSSVLTVECSNLSVTTIEPMKRITRFSTRAVSVSPEPILIPVPKVCRVRKRPGPNTPSATKMKRRRRNVNWHHCTVDWCTKKFIRETQWWTHMKKVHSDDELMQ